MIVPHLMLLALAALGSGSANTCSQNEADFCPAPATKGLLLFQLDQSKSMAAKVMRHRAEASEASSAKASSAEASASAWPAFRPSVTVQGSQVLVNGKAVHLKGINWNPIMAGGEPPYSLNFKDHVEQDSKLMQKAGINAVRTYECITDPKILDVLMERGIWVLNTVFWYGGDAEDAVIDRINAVKDHPAVLMWVIGNEWNYNHFYYNSLSYDATVQKIDRISRIVKQTDPSRPVSSIYGNVPPASVLQTLSAIDVWGINRYSGITLGSLFTDWQAASTKPMYLGEYGADAYNSNIKAEDLISQALATQRLTQEIYDHNSLAGGVCIGGMIFELADEWWKDSTGNNWVQDVGGVAPGGGPYPDFVYNEEWWGLVRMDRSPRPAYDTYAQMGLPGGSSVPGPMTA